MRAVNLIPRDAAKGERSKLSVTAPSGSIGAYVVLAVLALAVAMSAAWALTSNQLSDKRSQLARVQREAATAEAKAATLKPYSDFAALRNARVETVGGLLDGRFDWAHGLREVARAIPRDVDLTSLVGTVSPSATVDGGAGGGGSLRAALPVPAFDLIGCARTQSEVARLLARLRTIDGVDRVTLVSSEKSDSAALNDTDCRRTPQMPQFQLTVFYKAQDGIVPVADASTTATPAAGGAASDPTTASAGGAK